MTIEWLWLGIGFLGQAMFSARFLVQWLASERARRSIVPRAFWFFSLAGAYAIYRRDPVFIAGYHQPYRGRTYLIVPADRWPAFVAAGDD